MTVDITEEFRALVRRAAAQSSGKHIDSSILRPVRRRTDFVKAVTDLSRQIRETRARLRSQRRRYVTPGLLPESERDRIEAEIVSFIKTCSMSLEHLSKTVAAMGQTALSDQAVAHHHGMVLIVSEELKELMVELDKYRSEHATQKRNLKDRRQRQQKKQEAKLKTLPHEVESVSARDGGDVTGEAQEMLQVENQALFEELTHLSGRVHETEKMMIEISTLNQMLSSQILGQSEQIEQIYTDAVQASLNMERGNTHLKKAVALNKSTLKYVAFLLILASFILLFFDRFYS